MKGIQLRDKFFAGNIAARSTANARGALSAAAPKGDFNMCRRLYGYAMKLIDYTRMFGSVALSFFRQQIA